MINIDSNLCKGCDICIITYPKDVLKNPKKKIQKMSILPFPK